MRVQLDNGRRQIDLEVENGLDTFIEVLAKALIAMNYKSTDLIREMEKQES